MLMRPLHSRRSRCAGAIMCIVWLLLSLCMPHLSLPNLALSGLATCLQDIMVGLECAEQRQSLQVTCCQHAPHPVLVAVTFYCCTCLSLPTPARYSQKDLQLQAVHLGNLFPCLSAQGSPVPLLRLLMSGPDSPEPAMLSLYKATATASPEAQRTSQHRLPLPCRSPTPSPMASCRTGTTCIMSGTTPSAASSGWTPQTAASF